MPARLRFWLGLSAPWIALAFLFDGITVLLLPLRLAGDAASLGLVSLLGLGLAALLQPLAGALSDQVRQQLDRRWFIAIAGVAALVGVWILIGSTGLVLAVAGYVLVQIAASAMQAGQQTLIPEHVDRTEQGRAAGLKAAFDVGGAFVGFVVLGVMLATGGLAGAGLAITVTVLAAIALLALIPRGRRPSGSAGSGLPPGFPSLMVARFLFLLATYGVGRFLLLLVAERLGIDPERAVDEAAGLLALLTLTTAVAAVPVGRLADRRSRRELMAAGALTSAVGIVALIPAAGLVGILGGGLLMSIGTALFATANWAATTALVPPVAAGKLMGVANLSTGLAAAAAGLLGPIIDVVGFEPALGIAAIAAVATLLPLAAWTTPTSQPSEVTV